MCNLEVEDEGNEALLQLSEYYESCPLVAKIIQHQPPYGIKSLLGVTSIHGRAEGEVVSHALCAYRGTYPRVQLLCSPSSEHIFKVQTLNSQ